MRLRLVLPKCREGQKMRAEYEGEMKFCEVVSIRKSAVDKGHEYYVHFLDTDQRLDRWVGEREIKRLTERDQNKLARKRKLSAAMGEDDDAWEQKFQENVKKRNIEQIYFSNCLIRAWYYSPYPAKYQQTRVLKVCDYCFKYMAQASSYFAHKEDCRVKHPPGNEIYRDNDKKISVFEVDGDAAKIYCQNLCLLSKLFLQHKTLYFDVAPFLFYLVCEFNDKLGHRMLGYFSKEKESSQNYNLSCIVVLPHAQRRNIGNFLISLSYEISKREDKVEVSPEKPLSDLGVKVYRSWWADEIIEFLALEIENGTKSCRLKDICEATRMTTIDVQETLQWLGVTDRTDGKCNILRKAEHIQGLYNDLLDRMEYREKAGKATFKRSLLEWPVKRWFSRRSLAVI